MMLISFLGRHYDYGLMHHRLHVGAPRRMLGMDQKTLTLVAAMPPDLHRLVGWRLERIALRVQGKRESKPV